MMTVLRETRISQGFALPGIARRVGVGRCHFGRVELRKKRASLPVRKSIAQILATDEHKLFDSDGLARELRA
jgi:transcriptional regulator with XRE-family HTH domain